ncbi:N-formylglutamate amidohydrolase [Falsochrobactrum shanghaiense]|uniref:N-formylglutamate amidohydrolase n=1 Tax=Falsochrobactrum shanghaiense TaxID=2201899 RepID=A0A316J6B1_9HYPH|nr:N-formylglutamate amidohydrolase [Falsochrobactrum shanghaiense]PWL16841.1 N-formylglutamate amidohydrolase [Falsochrobactrum shanghaiense]
MPFSPAHLIDGDFSVGLLLTADHARRDVPSEYGSLGLAQSQFDRHIAYDIGVEELTRQLALRLNAPAVMGGFSRLLIDPNRGEDDPTLIMQLSDGAVISGNYPLSAHERETRLKHFYRPYHDAVARQSARVASTSGKAPFIVSIHSFTPHWKGRARPWHIGLLWDSDPRAVTPLLSMLRENPDLIVGDNEPYDGALRNDAMYRHATANGYAHVLIEVRQDLIAEKSGAGQWAERLAPMLESINAQPEIHEIRHFGSRTGPVI